MSVISLSSSTMDKFFEEDVADGLHEQFYLNTKIYGRFKTNTRDCFGSNGITKLLTQSARSARASNDSTFPTGDSSSYAEFSYYMKRAMYATLQFDGLAQACAKGKGAIADLVTQEIKNTEGYVSHKLNKQFWGDGSGRLAQLRAASTASVTVDIDGGLGYFGVSTDEYTNPAQLLFEGMYVDIYSSAGVLEAENVKISTIVDDGDGTATLTMATAVTASNDAYIFDHNTYVTSEAAGSGVPMGLMGIISASNPYAGITALSAFQGINRSSYAYAQAQVVANGTSAAVFNSKTLLKAVQQLNNYSKVKVVIVNLPIWRNIYAIWEADKSMPNPDDHVFWGGTGGIKFYGGDSKAIPIIYDEDCPDQTAFLIDDDYIRVVSPGMKATEWERGGDGHIVQKVPGKDESSAHLKWYYNMTTNKPKALGKVTYIKHAES